MGWLFARFELKKNDYTYKVVITLINLSKTERKRERDLVTGDCFLVEFFFSALDHISVYFALYKQ